MTVEDLKALGAVIQFHRKKAGLSQAELAKFAGVGKTAIFDVEHAVKQPRLSTILAILAILNIKLSLDSPLMKAYEEQRHATS